jgi:hypothetical protein
MTIGIVRPFAPRWRALRGLPRALRHTVVVEPQELDHLADVGVVLDPPRRGSGAAREDGMVSHPARFPQRGADRRREPEVGGVVAVEVADLTAVES